MGLHKFLMKHGLGSPGYIARKMATRYQELSLQRPSIDERGILRAILVERIAAQTVAGGPIPYHILRRFPDAIEELLNYHVDIYSVVLLAIFIEHPELINPFAPSNALDVLVETVQETLDTVFPGWRTSGYWDNPFAICYLCGAEIVQPDAGTMSAAIDDKGLIEYHCASCTFPIDFRAKSDLGFFMDERFKAVM